MPWPWSSPEWHRRHGDWRVGNYYTLRHPSLLGTCHRTQFYTDYPSSPWSRLLTRDDVDIDMDFAYRIQELVVVHYIQGQRHHCMQGRNRHCIKYVAAKSYYYPDEDSDPVVFWTNLQRGRALWCVPIGNPRQWNRRMRVDLVN